MKQTNLFSCIVAAVLTFAAASCSDEPNGGSHGLSGRKVAFSTKVSLDDNAKKVYLGTPNVDNIPVLWSTDDKVKIYTSDNTANNIQVGVYTVTPTGDGSTATLKYLEGDEIEWMVGSGSQTFCSILGNGSMEHEHAGDFRWYYTIPAEQDGLVATASKGNSAAVAVGYGTVNVTTKPNVTLDYTLESDVIRLTIPAGEGITSVTFSDGEKPLSGTFEKGFSYTDIKDGGNITVNFDEPVSQGKTINVYTLSWGFDHLAITVSGPTGSCTKTVSTYIKYGEVTDISFGDSYELKSEFVMQVKVGADYQLANQWNGEIRYKINNEAEKTLGKDEEIELKELSQGDIVRVWEGADDVFRSWNSSISNSFIKLVSGAEEGNVALLSMPPMNCFTEDQAGTTAGDNFFSCFNSYGALTSLPAGSFDTSSITTVGDNFFNCLGNQYMTSLPAGSFDTSNITTTGDSFFVGFNGSGALTSLPVGSFDTSNITTTGTRFFLCFNTSGALTSLPAGSFKLSSITTIGDDFFDSFNNYGALTSLPVGSFDTSGISVGNYQNFFRGFNNEGKLEKGSVGDVVITNKSNEDITAYYWNGNGSDEENVLKSTGTMIYKKQSSELPPSPVSTQADVSPKGAVKVEME